MKRKTEKKTISKLSCDMYWRLLDGYHGYSKLPVSIMGTLLFYCWQWKSFHGYDGQILHPKKIGYCICYLKPNFHFHTELFFCSMLHTQNLYIYFIDKRVCISYLNIRQILSVKHFGLIQYILLYKFIHITNFLTKKFVS